MKGRTSISYVMYCLFVVLTIYQDSPFSLFVGAAGYSIVMPLSIIAFPIVVAFDKLKIYRIKEIRRLWILALWLIFSSIFGILAWKVLGNKLTVVGEFLPYKALKVWLQYISYPMYIYIMVRWMKNIDGLDNIFKPIFVSVVIMTIVCIIETTQIPNAFEWLHFAGHFPYYRVRLLTYESSYTANLIFIYVGLSIFYAILYKKKVILIITLLCTVILTINSGSKTFLLSIVIFTAIYIINAGIITRKRLLYTLLIGTILVVVTAYYLLPRLSLSFTRDIQKYTSFITRSYTILIGIGIGIVFPAGVGCGAYLGFYQDALKKYVYLIKKLPLAFNTVEIQRLANQSTDNALAIKGGFISYNMYWGILGMIVLVFAIVDIYKQMSRLRIRHIDILKTIFITSIILSTFAYLSFETWLLISIIIYITKKYESVVMK